MQYFPNLKQGDPINRRWFNDLIGFCNSLVLRGDGRTTRVTRTASGTTVTAITQAVAAGGGSFRNFAMSPDAAGTGIVIGEGWYYTEYGGAIDIYHQSPSAVSSANMPPADGKIYYYCLGMHGAPPWIGGFNGTTPGWGVMGPAPTGLTPVVIGAVRMTTPVQVFQPPALGVPVIPALPSEDFAVYATYNRTAAPDNAYPSFDKIPPYEIKVNGGWSSNATYYHGTSVPPKDPWEHNAGATFAPSVFSGGWLMIALRFGPDGEDTIITGSVSQSVFPSFAWDYQTKRAIFPLARVAYYPAGAGLTIEQVHTGAVYAAPLYDPTE